MDAKEKQFVTGNNQNKLDRCYDYCEDEGSPSLYTDLF